MRYLQNVDSRGSTPRTPNLEPIAINEEHDRSFIHTQKLAINREVGGGCEIDTIVQTKHEGFTRRSQSLESRFECYENNYTHNALVGKTRNSLQSKTQLPRKLPALEVKAATMHVRGKHSIF